MPKDRRVAPLWIAALAAWSFVLAPVAADEAIAPGGLTAEELAKVRSVEASRIAAIDKVYHSVVAIYGMNRQGGGSGVVYDPAGYVLTNYHVTAGAGVEGWGGLADGKLYKWKLIGHDPGGDVAIIKLEGPTPDHQFHYARLADSDAVRVGDFAMAMGNPFILAEDQTPTVTLGIVSGVKRYQPGTGPGGKMLEYGNCIQIDSSINPGNSGGPLFNMQGEVIGINGRGSFEERGRVNVGLGYAISANQCKLFIPDLLATKTCEHGTLDAVFNRRGNNEVVCESINLDSPLAKAGFELGDRLIKFNGETIRTTHEFTNLIATLPAHWPVEVVWDHDGQTKSAWVRLTPILYPKPPAPRPQPRPVPTPPKPDDKSKPKADEKPAPKAEAPKSEEPKPTAKPAPAAPPADDDQSADGPTIKELNEKLKRLEEVRAAVQDNPPALKDLERRIAEVKAQIKELETEKPAPAPPAEDESEPIDPPAKPEPAKDKSKDAPKDLPKDAPKEQPKPPQPPQPRPVPLQGLQQPLEFGKMRDMKINEREALRIIDQYQAFLGGREALKNIKAIRSTVESRLNDKVLGTSESLYAADGRGRVVRTDDADGGKTRWSSVWDGQRFWQDMNGQSRTLEGDQAKRHPAVAMSMLWAGMRGEKPKDAFKRIVLQGSDKSQGQPAYRILFEDHAGNRMIAWLSVLNAAGDFETRLLKVSFADEKDQPRDPSVLIDDYRPLEGIRFAYVSRTVTGLEESVVSELVVTKVELLRELEKDAFAIPAEGK